jgi:hypothetical protein
VYGTDVAEPPDSVLISYVVNVTPPFVETWNCTVPVADDGETVAVSVTCPLSTIELAESAVVVVEDVAMVVVVVVMLEAGTPQDGESMSIQ